MFELTHRGSFLYVDLSGLYIEMNRTNVVNVSGYSA